MRQRTSKSGIADPDGQKVGLVALPWNLHLDVMSDDEGEWDNVQVYEVTNTPYRNRDCSCVASPSYHIYSSRYLHLLPDLVIFTPAKHRYPVYTYPTMRMAKTTSYSQPWAS
jgi:hypothetical protein